MAVGAHIAYRIRRFRAPPDDAVGSRLEADVIYQDRCAAGMAQVAGTEVSYVKPHGALYNDRIRRAAGGRGDRRSRPPTPIRARVWPPHPIVDQIRAAGLRAVPEAFADRAYEPNGALVSRREAGAVLEDPDLIAERMLTLVRDGVVVARDGARVAIEADSICVHGDSPGAVHIATVVRDRLTEAGVTLRPFAARS